MTEPSDTPRKTVELDIPATAEEREAVTALSDTPRTDAIRRRDERCLATPRVWDFARQLERELGTAQEDTRLLASMTKVADGLQRERDQLRKDLAAARAEHDEFRKDIDYIRTDRDRLAAERDEALQIAECKTLREMSNECARARLNEHHLAAEVEGLKRVLENTRDLMSCHCSLSERESGHRIDCSLPQLKDEIDAALAQVKEPRG